MGYLYSKKENGFYHTDVHGKDVPDDAVPISDAKHRALMEAQSTNKEIVGGDDGFPVSVAIPISEKDAIDAVTVERSNRLRASDVVVLRAYEAGEPVPEAWVKYRQALRDIPTQNGYPFKVTWPKEPG